MKNEEKISKAHESINYAKKAAALGNYVEASFYATRALQLYGRANSSDGIKESKRLTVEYNRKSEKQMRSLDYSIELDQKTKDGLEALITEFTKASYIDDNLERIIRSRVLVPRFLTAVKNAKEIVPLTSQIATHFSIGDEGHLASFDDFENEWLAYHYRTQLQLTMTLLDESMSRLILKDQFNVENIMNVVIKKELLTVDSLLKLETALERRFENDYVSSLHVLVPLIEKVFMNLSGKVGLDTISYNGKTVSTRNATLSPAILDSHEYQEGWGSDFCIMLRFFLLDANGYKFRHKIAHGDISASECNYTSFNLVFYLLMRIILKVEAKHL